MKVLVTGSRQWTSAHDVARLRDALRELIPLCAFGETLTIIHGDCKGADTHCRQWAEENARYFYGVALVQKPYPADWGLGRKAGPLRNQQMIDENPDIDLCVAFHMSGRGTADCIGRAHAAGIPVWQHPHGQPSAPMPRLARRF